MVKNKSNLQDLELAILRNAVDKIEANVGMKKIQNPEISALIKIVEEFIQKKKRICYGGTAINNILPERERFYNKDIETIETIKSFNELLNMPQDDDYI